MRSIVTGAAGFVGSHLCDYLLSQGDEVVGIDCFTDYYSIERKRANVAPLLDRDGFRFYPGNLRWAPLDTLLNGVDVVYHLAGQPGVRPSWGKDFQTYVDRNVIATQNLLEECQHRALWKVVYASSSSVYGDAETLPTSESVCPRPVSPYGVTKLAAEHLCELYRSTSKLPTASLRLFTVYGPSQRPDMAFSRLVSAAVRGEQFQLYGDGTQTRDFTYVGDVVRAMRDAAVSPWTGVANIGGGARTSMKEVIDIVSELAGGFELIERPVQRGDVGHTGADTTVAREAFGYRPAVSLREGLGHMVDAERLLIELPLSEAV
jgi:nucleoside-diphosphate-sugar epimerase